MTKITEAQIKHMVDRFLSWKLPEDFSPDAGISFAPFFNSYGGQPDRHNPIGTNLFTAAQARTMIEYLVDGLPSEPQT